MRNNLHRGRFNFNFDFQGYRVRVQRTLHGMRFSVVNVNREQTKNRRGAPRSTRASLRVRACVLIRVTFAPS